MTTEHKIDSAPGVAQQSARAADRDGPKRLQGKLAELREAGPQIGQWLDCEGLEPVEKFDPDVCQLDAQLNFARVSREAGDGNAEAAALSQVLARQLEPYFARVFSKGTAVVVNLSSFEFVHASTRTDALKLFVARFGAAAPGWAFVTGVPMSAGAGECTS